MNIKWVGDKQTKTGLEFFDAATSAGSSSFMSRATSAGLVRTSTGVFATNISTTIYNCCKAMTNAPPRWLKKLLRLWDLFNVGTAVGGSYFWMWEFWLLFTDVIIQALQGYFAHDAYARNYSLPTILQTIVLAVFVLSTCETFLQNARASCVMVNIVCDLAFVIVRLSMKVTFLSLWFPSAFTALSFMYPMLFSFIRLKEVISWTDHYQAKLNVAHQYPAILPQVFGFYSDDSPWTSLERKFIRLIFYPLWIIVCAIFTFVIFERTITNCDRALGDAFPS